jgi:hypothetical protein
MTVVRVMEPEVAVIVTFDIPGGVMGLEPPHPSRKAVGTSRGTNKPSRRMWLSLPDDRRWQNATSEPNGRRRAAVIPAAYVPRKNPGKSSAEDFFVVWMVRVLVALAEAVAVI